MSSEIKYKNQSLFDVPEGSIIIHACNSKGVWGSGIAKEFKQRYPNAYLEYRDWCHFLGARFGSACGESNLIQATNEKHYVGWIVTSHGYGNEVDPPQVIKIHTESALRDLCDNIERKYPMRIVTIYSNKFNSGLFKVPWEETECILKEVLEDYPRIKWVVCSVDM